LHVAAKENPFSLREKARMRGYRIRKLYLNPLSPTLSRRERGVNEMIMRRSD